MWRHRRHSKSIARFPDRSLWFSKGADTCRSTKNPRSLFGRLLGSSQHPSHSLAQVSTRNIMRQTSSVGRASRRYSRGTGHRRWAIVIIGVLAMPVLAAIWAHPWFVTQDGSIYLYNTSIILESLKSNNPFQDYYTVHWVPLPYWGAYFLLGALMSLFSERLADHLMITIASLGLLACILWLRHRIAGWNGMAFVVPLAVILSLNLLWLLGLYNFLLGACCYVVALGVWWAGRDDSGPRRAVLLAGLLIAGCLCHLF